MSLEHALKQLADAVGESVHKRLEPILSKMNPITAVVNAEQILTRDEAAKYLKLTSNTLAMMASQKRGPHFYKIGRLVRYKKVDLDTWLEANPWRRVRQQSQVRSSDPKHERSAKAKRKPQTSEMMSDSESNRLNGETNGS